MPRRQQRSDNRQFAPPRPALGPVISGKGKIKVDIDAVIKVGGLAGIFLGLRRRGQLGEGVLLDDVYVTSRDTAAGVDVASEVVACHGLKGLRLAEIGVATGNNATGINVAN